MKNNDQLTADGCVKSSMTTCFRRVLSMLGVVLVFIAPPAFAVELPSTSAPVLQGSADDPLEAINRPIFRFNMGLDKWALRPIAQGYDYIAPAWMQAGVSNVFDNLGELSTFVNATLQGRFDYAGIAVGRFLVNSTLGLAGTLDVAERMGMAPYDTDFGHTLATWGAPAGPYLVVPALGPRTVRSGAGSIAEVYLSPLTYSDNARLKNTLRGIGVVNDRAALLDAERLMTGDRYVFVREAYLARRQQLTGEQDAADDFSSGFDEDWSDEPDL